MIGVGIVGCGYWGPNLVRNFMEAEGSTVPVVCDLSADRRAQAGRRYPAIKTTDDFGALLDDPGVDAVAIATPVSTHFKLAMQALKAGKHVLVEKPLAANSSEALQLLDEAAG